MHKFMLTESLRGKFGRVCGGAIVFVASLHDGSDSDGFEFDADTGTRDAPPAATARARVPARSAQLPLMVRGELVSLI